MKKMLLYLSTYILFYSFIFASYDPEKINKKAIQSL